MSEISPERIVEIQAQDEALRRAEIERAQAAWNAREARKKQQSKRTRQRKDTARRRWTLLNCFVDEGMGDLKPADVAVWLALFRHGSADGLATVARSRVVAMTGLTVKTVSAALRRLIDAGCLERLKHGGPSGGVAVYRLKRNGKAGQ